MADKRNDATGSEKAERKRRAQLLKQIRRRFDERAARASRDENKKR